MIKQILVCGTQIYLVILLSKKREQEKKKKEFKIKQRSMK